MKIGIDFDNTLVNYDRVFQRQALRLGLISAGVAANKRVIRDTIRRLPEGGRLWTELQGLVYGRYIAEAEAAPGVERFLASCLGRGIGIAIVSHKTVHPALGPPYDLRAGARRWLKERGLAARFGIAPDDCFFGDTAAAKRERIAACGCDYFIDDLVEFLAHPEFPGGVGRVLYSANPAGELPAHITHCATWEEIHDFILGE